MSDNKDRQGVALTDRQIRDIAARFQAMPNDDDGFVSFYSTNLERFVREILRASSSRAEVESAAARDVLAERRRQVEAEGWTPEHDDEHDEGQLSLAAAGYAQSASDQIQCVVKGLDDSTLEDHGVPSTTFPYGWKFKPATPRRMLVKAGALVLAEIERIDRLAAAEAGDEK